jgi:hypothetical protein
MTVLTARAGELERGHHGSSAGFEKLVVRARAAERSALLPPVPRSGRAGAGGGVGGEGG